VNESLEDEINDYTDSLIFTWRTRTFWKNTILQEM
jgi:hypothetical protein